MRRLLLALLALTSACGTGAAPSALNAQPSPSATCLDAHVVGRSGPGGAPFTMKLDGGSYHRIPTSLDAPARVRVTISDAPEIRLEQVEAVVVREGVDTGNGPFARRILVARDVPADGRTFDLTLPATDAAGVALPAGEYAWGMQVRYRELRNDACGATGDSDARYLGQEMPFLIVR